MKCWPRYLYDREANMPQRKATSATRFIHATRACLAFGNDEEMMVQRDKKPPKLTGTRGNKKDQTLNSLDISWGGKIHADDTGEHSTEL
jgi:hypothetical protein